MSIKAVVSDFGGVLTTPLMSSFLAVQDQTGISFEQFGRAMRSAADGEGVHPLFALEKGHMTEPEFIEKLRVHLEPELGHRPELHRFSEIYFEALDPNEPMIELMRDLRQRGLRMALLTNNVREWEPMWRSMLPVDEIFEFVVDSAFVGMRKPEREIYELTVDRFGGVGADECLFVDDIELNCRAAEDFGMRAVHYVDPAQAIAEIEAALGSETA
jgi:epoxide hydrolase-like predicted phosphatase